METDAWESFIEDLFEPIEPSDFLKWDFESMCSPPRTMCHSGQSDSSVYQGRFSAEFAQSQSGGPLVLYFCEPCSKSYLSFLHLRRHVNEDHVVPKVGLLRSLSHRASRIRGHLDKHKRRQPPEREHICGGPGELWGCQRHFAAAADFCQHFQTEAGRDCIDLFLLKGSVDMRQVQLPRSFGLTDGDLRLQNKTDSLLPAALLAKYPALQDCAHCTSSAESDSDSNLSCYRQAQHQEYDHKRATYSAQLLSDKGSQRSGDIQQKAKVDARKQFTCTNPNTYLGDPEKPLPATPKKQSVVTDQQIALPFRDSHREQPRAGFVSSKQHLYDARPNVPEKVRSGQCQSPSLQPYNNDSSLRVDQAGKRLPPPSLNSLTTYSNPSEGELSFIGLTISATHTAMQLDELDMDVYLFATELARRIVKRCVILYKQKPFRKRATAGKTQSSSPGTAPSTASARDSKNSLVPSGKRSLQEDDDDNDNLPSKDGKDNREPHPKRIRGNEGSSARLFACPYAKFDPERYSEQNQNEKHYRKCTSKYLINITRVKQHLYRTHMRPPWYCGNCYEDFKTRDELNEHSRMRPPCNQRPSMYEEKMTDEQYRLIKRRSQGNTDRESWYRIFQVLFPNAPRPMSPYVSTCDTVAVQHFVALFRWYGPEEFMSLMQSRQDRNGGLSPLEASTQAVVDEAFEIALPEYLDQVNRSQKPETRPRTKSIAEEERCDDNFSFVASIDGEEEEDDRSRDSSQQVTGVQLDTAQSVSHETTKQIEDDWTIPQSDELVPFAPQPLVSDTWHFDASEVNDAFGTYNMFADIDFSGATWIDVKSDDPSAHVYSVS